MLDLLAYFLTLKEDFSIHQLSPKGLKGVIPSDVFCSEKLSTFGGGGGRSSLLENVEIETCLLHHNPFLGVECVQTRTC